MSTDGEADEHVFGDVGGWISGPSLAVERLDARQLGGPRFGINVGAWMKEYGPRYVLQGGFDGFGFVCWRRSGEGRPAGAADQGRDARWPGRNDRPPRGAHKRSAPPAVADEALALRSTVR